jgi:hypothetical protein
VNRLPPTIPPRRWLLATSVLALALPGVGCQAHPDESAAGLLIASNGSIGVTSADRQPEIIESPPGVVRRVTASSGRIVAETADNGLFVSDAAAAGSAREWRPLAPVGSSSRTSTGMDLSPDGRTVAVVLGGPDMSGLQLVTIDVDTDSAKTRSLDLMANGPPSWLGPDLLALEVIRPDQHSGIATVDLATGDVKVTDAQGFAPSATRDGGRVAVIDATSGLVTITDATEWLAGVPKAALEVSSPAAATIEDVALDADGTRLAIAYAADSGASGSVTILRHAATTWQTESTIPINADARVSIDWLD